MFRVGLLGHGTVGLGVRGAAAAQAARIERLTGSAAGAVRRDDPQSGSFDELLEGSDLIVELIGGIDPARE